MQRRKTFQEAHCSHLRGSFKKVISSGLYFQIELNAVEFLQLRFGFWLMKKWASVTYDSLQNGTKNKGPELGPQ